MGLPLDFPSSNTIAIPTCNKLDFHSMKKAWCLMEHARYCIIWIQPQFPHFPLTIVHGSRLVKGLCLNILGLPSGWPSCLWLPRFRWHSKKPLLSSGPTPWRLILSYHVLICLVMAVFAASCSRPWPCRFILIANGMLPSTECAE